MDLLPLSPGPETPPLSLGPEDTSGLYITIGNKAVLDDPVTARYKHTLSVTERLEGLYTCSVANKLSHTSVQLNVEGEKSCFDKPLCYLYLSQLLTNPPM